MINRFWKFKMIYQLLRCEACLQIAENEQQAGGVCCTQADQQQILSDCSLVEISNVVSMDVLTACTMPCTCPHACSF